MNETSASVNAEKAKLVEIEAQVAVSKKRISELRAGLEAAKANLELQEANLNQAEKDSKRAENLFKSEYYTERKIRKNNDRLGRFCAQVKAAGEQLKQAEKALETQKAIVRQTEVQDFTTLQDKRKRSTVKDCSQLNYGYTKIYAPADGYITKKSVEVGNQIQAGQPLMAVVSLDDIYITANYKETQLEKVKPGQKVKL